MEFNDFVKMYTMWTQMNQPQAQNRAGVNPTNPTGQFSGLQPMGQNTASLPMMPSGMPEQNVQPMMPNSTASDVLQMKDMLSQMNQRLAMMEQRSLNPQGTGQPVDQMGDIMNKFLG